MKGLKHLVLAGLSACLMAGEAPRREVTTQEVAREYEFYRLKSEALTEYKFAYVLTRTREAILAAQHRLAAGESLGEVARDLSIDPASKNNNGELFWADPIVWDPAIAEAVAKLKPGETTPEPVPNPFGWAIIKLLKTRKAVFPPQWALEPALRFSLAQRLDLIRQARDHGQALATLFPKETLSPVLFDYLVGAGADADQLKALPASPDHGKSLRTMMAMLNLKFFEYPASKGAILPEKVLQTYLPTTMNR